MVEAIVPTQNNGNTKFNDQDATSTQGFEALDKNMIFIYPGDCPHCLKPFLGRGAEGSAINVYTIHGKTQWCATCVREGIKSGVCVQESKLSKQEKKAWEKKIKKGELNG